MLAQRLCTGKGSMSHTAEAEPTTNDRFTAFVKEAEPPLQRALVARWGVDVGRQATADALSWGWEHWQRVEEMGNPIGIPLPRGLHQGPTVRKTRTSRAATGRTRALALGRAGNFPMPWGIDATSANRRRTDPFIRVDPPGSRRAARLGRGARSNDTKLQRSESSKDP